MRITNILFLSLYTSLKCNKAKPPTNEDMKYMKSLSKPERIAVNGEFLKSILVQRVSGSENNKVVRDFLTTKMQYLGWEITRDTFIGDTPHGLINFTNIIATHNPNARNKVVFAAHFDSKYYKPPNKFIGAIDSAVPCALMLDLAYSLTPDLNKNKHDTTIQFIFFDGEEAFTEWSRTESTYGARHLAQIWEKSHNLENIEVLILLDLLGTKDGKLYSLQSKGDHYFKLMAKAEDKILESRSSSITSLDRIFIDRPYNAAVEDDHIPFMERNVTIVHLIPPHFPSVWHKFSDNADAISHEVVDHLSLVFRTFVYNYLCIIQKRTQ